MSLNAKEVAEILKVLEASSFDTLDLEIDGVKLSLRRTGAAPAPQRDQAESTPLAGRPEAAAGQPASLPASPSMPDELPAGTQAVPAPLLGVFYRAPRPGEPAFVEVGSRVREDSIIGIIEVMKLMNTVRAGVTGEVVSIPARNGELVEYGEALLYVRAG